MGYDMVRYGKKKLLKNYEINVVLDVGAYIGQYAKELRAIGYKARIISFEPLSSSFIQLSINSKTDGAWEVFNFALGDTEDNCIINIAVNSRSSSILEILPSHIHAAPNSKYIGSEQIQIKTLDSLFDTLKISKNNILLKIDTQGFEQNVIAGAKNSLQFIDTIQIEMSLIPLYCDELLFSDMYQILNQLGYHMVSIEPAFWDLDTGQLLQVDGIFHRY